MSWLASFFGRRAATTETVATPLNLVTYAAGLVANPDAIDRLLDTVRHVTSHMQPGQPVSRDDEEVLLTTYLELERYLIIREPMRAYTKTELRKRLSPALLQKLSAYEGSAQSRTTKTVSV